MYQKLRIKENTKVIDGVMSMTTEAPEMTAATKPGQFYMLKGWDGTVPFLMRPISVNSVNKEMGTLTFLYKIVGEGTAIIARLKSGEYINALGPQGNGFEIPNGCKRIAVIGRGIGIAPLRFLVESCLQRGIEVYAYLSAKREDEIFHREYFKEIGAVVRTTTDPNKKVTDFFEEDCENFKFDAAYSCGSKRLGGHMKELHEKYGFPAYISLEEHMGCGIGACKGCVCTVRDEKGDEEYSLVCKCGPVYPVNRVIL